MENQEIIVELEKIKKEKATTSATMNEMLNEKNRLQREYNNLLSPTSEYSKEQELKKQKRVKVFRIIFIITLIIAVIGAFITLYLATSSKGDLEKINLTYTVGFIFSPFYPLTIIFYFFCDFHIYNRLEEEQGERVKQKVRKIKPTKEVLDLVDRISSASNSYEFYKSKLKNLSDKEKELENSLNEKN